MAVEAFLNESKYPGNTEAFTELKAFLLEGEIVAFTGAGIGIPVFQTWNGLLSSFLSDAVSQGFLSEASLPEYQRLLGKDPLELAEQLEHAFTSEVFRTRFADRFRNSKNEITECHRRLNNLSLKGIVTLN